MNTVLFIAVAICGIFSVICYLGALSNAREPLKSIMVSPFFMSDEFERRHFDEKGRRALEWCRNSARICLLMVLGVMISEFFMSE